MTRRLEILIKRVCRQLGTYNYRKVHDALKARARARWKSKYARNMPSRKQIIKIISTARWSKVIRPGGKHRPTEYEFCGGPEEEHEF